MAEMSRKEMPGTKGVVWKTLRYFFPIAWKFDKMYFILSVVNVIAGAALPFVDILLLPLLVDSLIAPERDVKLIITYAALMVAASFVTISLTRHGDNRPDKPKSALEAFDAGDD